MLDKEHRYNFIEKHSNNCTPEQLLDNHFHYYTNYKNGDFHEPVQSFSDCLWYIKKFINRNKPTEAIRILDRRAHV